MIYIIIVYKNIYEFVMCQMLSIFGESTIYFLYSVILDLH